MRLINRKIRWMHGTTIKKNYKGKTDSKARKEGYATPDITFKDRNMVKQKLGQGYSYSIVLLTPKILFRD